MVWVAILSSLRLETRELERSPIVSLPLAHELFAIKSSLTLYSLAYACVLQSFKTHTNRTNSKGDT